jgi:hypothetical protein
VFRVAEQEDRCPETEHRSHEDPHLQHQVSEPLFSHEVLSLGADDDQPPDDGHDPHDQERLGHENVLVDDGTHRV